MAATIAGCSMTAQQRAIQAGMVAREVVDTGAQTLAVHMQERARSCADEQGRAAFDACLGPVASKPKQVKAALEAVRSAQVALWLALASGDSGSMGDARSKLMAALGQLARLVTAAKGTR